ncbi:putative ribonuclease H-like domain-containing protein [Tanacetum coccineum]
MIQVKEMMQDNDLKNSKSKDKGSRSRSQSMNEQSHYKQDKTKTRQSINVKSHILNVIGGTEECEERDLNIGGDSFGITTTTYPVPSTPNTRIHKDHSLDHVIGDVQSGVQTRRMTKTTNEQGFISAVYEGKTHEDLHTCLFACFLSQVEPKKKVWTLVDLPYGKRAIGTKWVYRNKKDERGIVVRNKARLVAQGYTQEEGIDYDEVFAPVARIEAIRLFLAYASFMNFVVYQMDVKSAFLYGKIEEEVYVYQPPGFEDPEFPDRVYKVEKALYGLHQAPRAWYETLSTYLLENGFQRGTIDKTLFIKKVKGDILLVQVYVDDIIFGSTKKELCTEFEKLMHKKFQMSSMGELTFFLGLQVMQKEDGIFISQDKYVDEILKKFGFSTVRIASTPMETSKPLLKDAEAEDVDVHLYRSMIGSLMYLTGSRPNIMFVINDWNRKVSAARQKVNAVGQKIVDFLNASPIRPTTLVADETVHKERGDNMERAATTATSLDTKQGTDLGSGPRRQDTMGDRPVQTRFERFSKQSNEPPFSRVNTIGSREDSMKLQELMDLCTKLSDRVLDLENVKDAQALEIKKSKKRVKKLESKKKSRTPQLKRRLFKVRIESSAEKSLEDSKTQRRYGHDIGVNTASISITTASINITTTQPVTTASAPITTAGVSISTAKPSTPTTTTTTTTTPIEDEDLTIAQTLMKMKSKKSKAKGVTMQEPSESGTRRLQAELDEEARLEREREEEASKAANIAEWDDVQAMMDADYELTVKLQAEEQGEISIEERYKRTQLKNKSFEEIQMLFEKEMKRVNIFVDMDAELVKNSETIKSEVDKAVPELAARSTRKYWKIIRVRNHTKVHHFIDDMLKAFNRDDLVMMWSLVKEKFNSTEPIDDKEREIWSASCVYRERNRHLHAGREGVSIVKRNSYIDAGKQSSWWIQEMRCQGNFLGRYSCRLKDKKTKVFGYISTVKICF